MFPTLYKIVVDYGDVDSLFLERQDIDSYMDLVVVLVHGLRCCIPLPMFNRESAIRFLKLQPKQEKRLSHKRKLVHKNKTKLKQSLQEYFDRNFELFHRNAVKMLEPQFILSNSNLD